MYAIVDIETTGSYASAHGITEVAIILFDGNRVVERFETLVNPGQEIPAYIQSFTGISNEMVADAPAFEDVAEPIYRLLSENIFVAHNVNFDYSFLKSHLLQCGYELKSKKLCTVRLSRKIFPSFPSYSLGNLSRSLGIKITNRHRAGGDAAATVKIFRQLLRNDREGFIKKSLLKSSHEQSLPPHVPREEFEKLPSSPGVYYFHDVKGKIIYVGKALNLRNRVNSHFSNNSDSRQKQNFMLHIHSISYRECATELMAIILESVEIKKYWPRFNYSQKSRNDFYGIYLFEDQKGYLRLAIEKNKRNLPPLVTFHTQLEGHALIRQLIEEFRLCPKLCFIQRGPGPCSGVENKSCKGACTGKEKKSGYNKRVRKAIEKLKSQPSFAIMDSGLEENEKSCILVMQGKFYGMGYVPAGLEAMSPDSLTTYLTTYKENSFIRNLLFSYRQRNPLKVVDLDIPGNEH